jgi:hypothetical protein
VSAPEPQQFRLAVGQGVKLVFTLDQLPASSVSGWAVRFRVRRPGGAPLVEKTLGAGVVCTNGTTGVWEVTVLDTDTTDSDKLAGRGGLYDWALWRTDDGSETPLAYGTCEVYRTAETG